MKSMIILILSAILAACGDSGSSTPAEPKGPVVFMGDSLTQGWSPQGLYGTPIANPTLDQLVPRSINAGISGQTSMQMLARFQTDVLDHRPSIVVILAGSNDIKLIPDPTTDSVAQMADEAQAAGAVVILGTIPDQQMWLYSDLVTETSEPLAVQAWNASIKALAATHGYIVADYYTVLDQNGAQNLTLFQEDGVHPDAAGYTQMWDDVLQPALVSAGVAR